MKRYTATLVALLTAGALQAQDLKVGALAEVWYTQMTDNSLRNNAAAKVPTSGYYEGLSSSRFAENNFVVKRLELSLSGKISDEISWNVMFDPNNSTSTVGNNILQDAVITWALGHGFVVKAGQFKMPTTYEATLVGSKDILFFDRNQLNRVFGDKRDRGVWASYAYGDAKGFQGKVGLAISNGTTDDGSSGKNNDLNAQKDYTVRFEGGYGPAHKFGGYYRTGVTNLKDSTSLAATIPTPWTTAGVTAAQVKDNKDKTTLGGLYYAFDNAAWHADFEYATGLIGRRYATLFATAAAPLREHLDQKFTGYAATGVYKMGRHWLLARYDLLNYNSGDDWYTAYNPYTHSAAGVSRNADYSPKFTELTLGYNYLFAPTKSSLGKLKLDYIMRSKNFLMPLTALGQVGEQGGNSLVASLMVAF
jgi:hypothetical protein